MRKKRHNLGIDQGIYENEMIKEGTSCKRSSKVMFSPVFLSINMLQFRGDENEGLFNNFLLK